MPKAAATLAAIHRCLSWSAIDTSAQELVMDDNDLVLNNHGDLGIAHLKKPPQTQGIMILNVGKQMSQTYHLIDI